jgi:tetratricopeptide (TPR) repeat protein
MNSPPLVHSADVGRIRAITSQRRHAEALAAAKLLLSEEPHNGEVLYLLAANQRCLNRISDALTSLARLERTHPRMSRLYQERGFCLMATRDATQAIAALEKGVTLNPALTASWSALEQLYRLIGDSNGSAAAAGQVASLRQLPAELAQARSLFADGDLNAAEAVLHTYIKSGSRSEAHHRVAHADLVRVLLGRQKYLEARIEIAGLLQLEPHNADYRSLNATASAGLGDHDSAITAYRELLDAEPAPHLHVLLGHSLKASGLQSEAIQSYCAAKDARGDFGDAYWSLANLKTYRFSNADTARMQDYLAAPTTRAEDRIHLQFALGRALESRGRYEESWRHYASGNAQKRVQSGYRPEFTELSTQHQIAVCTQRFFAERAGFGASDADPIFIVGLPRSGSTLIEQILASHSRVQGTQELNVVPRIVQELQARSDPGGPKYPRALRDLESKGLRNLGNRYLAETRAFRNSKAGAPFFIDKMPNNFRHIALIHLMLPNAKIIDARREPMACCFSNFKQLFAAGQEFSYDLEFLARYYRSYLELMQHWDDVLPDRVHRIVHEDVLEDLEGSVRRLLDYCGLGFEPACVEFHKTIRSIATASSEQVRQPLNRESLDQWMHYRPWLQPLEDLLGDARLRYNAR